MSLRLQDGSLLLQNGILPPCSNASFALAKIQHFAADSKKNSLIELAKMSLSFSFCPERKPKQKKECKNVLSSEAGCPIIVIIR
jgi:hypothetical protein